MVAGAGTSSRPASKQGSQGLRASGRPESRAFSCLRSRWLSPTHPQGTSGPGTPQAASRRPTCARTVGLPEIRRRGPGTPSTATRWSTPGSRWAPCAMAATKSADKRKLHSLLSWTERRDKTESFVLSLEVKTKRICTCADALLRDRLGAALGGAAHREKSLQEFKELSQSLRRNPAALAAAESSAVAERAAEALANCSLQYEGRFVMFEVFGDRMQRSPLKVVWAGLIAGSGGHRPCKSFLLWAFPKQGQQPPSRPK